MRPNYKTEKISVAKQMLSEMERSGLNTLNYQGTDYTLSQVSEEITGKTAKAKGMLEVLINVAKGQNRI